MNPDSGADTPLRPTSASSSHAVVIFIAWLAVAAPLIVIGVVVGALVPVVTWWMGLAVGALIGVIWVAARLRGAAARLLRTVGAEPADETQHARFFNLVQGLSLAGGISEPELFVVSDQGRNVVAIGQGDRTAVVITSGLLDAIDRISLEGLVADALVRIGNGDAEAATLGAALFGPLERGPLASLVRPLVGFGYGRLLGPDRDLLADRAAVALTRYPPGLLSALDLIRAGTPAVATPAPAPEHVARVARPAERRRRSRPPDRRPRRAVEP